MPTSALREAWGLPPTRTRASENEAPCITARRGGILCVRPRMQGQGEMKWQAGSEEWATALDSTTIRNMVLGIPRRLFQSRGSSHSTPPRSRPRTNASIRATSLLPSKKSIL
jgi:hypothetical protein